MLMKRILAGVALLAAFPIIAADWPVWRGEKRDSTTPETVNAEALTASPLWIAEVGPGYSSVSVYKGKLLTAGNKNDRDIIYCLDAATGKEIWNYSYQCNAVKSYPGPRATPVTDGKNVYMVSREGDVACVDLSTGALKWEQKKLASGDVKNIKWGLSSSVLLCDNMAIVNIGGKGMAFDAATGKPVWQSAGEGNYSTPVVFAFNGKEYLSIFSAEKLLILEPRTGNEIASYPWITKNNVNAADPVIADGGGKILISSAYNHGCALLGFDGRTLTRIWENKNLLCHFSTPVLVGGIVYSSSGSPGRGNLIAMQLADGKLCWKSNEIKFGSLILAGDTLAYLDETGAVSLVKTSAVKCETVKTVKIPELAAAKCWTMPVLAEGRMYCRNSKGALVCLKAQ
ncbi:MAG: PQQ-binding-like beta-propeller repeat protein [Victivallaceae bacterium]